MRSFAHRLTFLAALVSMYGVLPLLTLAAFVKGDIGAATVFSLTLFITIASASVLIAFWRPESALRRPPSEK